MKTITSIKRVAFDELISELLELDDSALETLQSLSEGKTKADRVKWRQVQALVGLEMTHSGALSELADDPIWDELIFREVDGAVQVIQKRNAAKAVRKLKVAVAMARHMR